MKVVTRLALGSLVVLGLALAGTSGATPPDGSPFLVGFADDLPRKAGTAATAPMLDLGATAVRFTLRRTGDETAISAAAAAELDRAVAAASGLRVVLTVFGPPDAAPQTAVDRDRFCAYARSALARYPAIRDVIVWNEPNVSAFWRPQFAPGGASVAPGAYEALLARCWDVLHAFRADVNVLGPATSAAGNDNPNAASNVSHSPGAFIRGVGSAYRASGRTLPILDTVAHHPYGDTPGERPWRRHIGTKTIALGDWNKLLQSLAAAFDGTAQPLPGQCAGGRCVAIWYTEHGFQTLVPPEKAGLYTGAENEAGVLRDDAGGEPDSPPPAETSTAPDQRTQVLDAVRLAACQPYVGAYLSFLVRDEAILSGWQSAPLWADGSAKGSAPALPSAFAPAARGTAACGAP
jgi:hypothetical protein